MAVEMQTAPKDSQGPREAPGAPRPAKPTGYRVGDLTLDLVERCIRRNGQILSCGRLTFDLIALLAARYPRVVTRDELVQDLWGGRYVSPAAIKQRIALLRRALGDRADEPRYFRVVRGRGLTLVTDVERLPASQARRRRWRLPALAAAALLVVFVLGAEIGYRDGLRPRGPSLEQAMSIIVTSWPALDSERTLSPDDYALVMGMAERVAAVLSERNYVGRLGEATDGGRSSAGPLTVVANAFADADAIKVRFTILNNAPSDETLNRIYSSDVWSRTIERVLMQRQQAGTLTLPEGLTLVPVPENRIALRPMLPRPRDRGSDRNRYALTAMFRYARTDVESDPDAVREHAARTIAEAIDEQGPRLNPFLIGGIGESPVPIVTIFGPV